MQNYTLDDIRNAADKKYGSTWIQHPEGDIELVNALRLSREKRDALQKSNEALSAEDADQGAILSDSLRLVCRNDEQADRLLGALDGDLALLVSVFELYTDGTQAGEASGSQG